MKIDITKIQGYAEMTAEDKVKALEEFEITADYTGYVKKADFDKTASEAADYKKKYRATLDEKEKMALEEADKRREIEEELITLKKDKELSDHKSRFIAIGYDEKTATETAQALIDGDMEKFFANQKAHSAAQEASIKANLLKDTPMPPAGGKKDDGKRALEGMTLIQKQELYHKDPEKYKGFFEEEK